MKLCMFLFIKYSADHDEMLHCCDFPDLQESSDGEEQVTKEG